MPPCSTLRDFFHFYHPNFYWIFDFSCAIFNLENSFKNSILTLQGPSPSPCRCHLWADLWLLSPLAVCSQSLHSFLLPFSFPFTCHLGYFAVLIQRCVRLHDTVLVLGGVRSLPVAAEWLQTSGFYWGSQLSVSSFNSDQSKGICLWSRCKSSSRHAQRQAGAKLGSSLSTPKFSARCLISVRWAFLYPVSTRSVPRVPPGWRSHCRLDISIHERDSGVQPWLQMHGLHSTWDATIRGHHGPPILSSVQDSAE